MEGHINLAVEDNIATNDNSIVLKRFSVKTEEENSPNLTSRRNGGGKVSDWQSQENSSDNSRVSRETQLKYDDVVLNLQNYEVATMTSRVPNHEASLQAWGSLKESDKTFIEMTKESDELTQLHRAALGNKLDVLCYLLDSGAEPNTRAGIEGLTPLHLSVR